MQPSKTALPGGECGVLRFRAEEDEATAIADIIERGVKTGGLVPGDFAVLVRQKVDAYGAAVAKAVSTRGIRVRIESPKTEFLTSQFALDLVAALRVAFHGRAPDEWERLRRLLSDLHEGTAARPAAVERAFAVCCESTRDMVIASAGAKARLRAALEAIVAHWGADAYLKARARTGDRESLDEVLEGLAEHLEAVFLETADWKTTIDDAAGIAFVPIMTIHKAKGREHHTVFFVGLEDNAFWSFKSDPDEAMRSFFVAFSRARRRVFFTFCEVRQGRSQSTASIRPIYDLLQQAGVPLLPFAPRA
jgi:superfamily I DNA/RNA helicase